MCTGALDDSLPGLPRPRQHRQHAQQKNRQGEGYHEVLCDLAVLFSCIGGSVVFSSSDASDFEKGGGGLFRDSEMDFLKSFAVVFHSLSVTRTHRL